MLYEKRNWGAENQKNPEALGGLSNLHNGLRYRYRITYGFASTEVVIELFHLPTLMHNSFIH